MISFPALTQLTDRVSSAFEGNTVASSVSLVIGLVIMLALCFFGYQAMKLFAAISGFLVGWIVGYGIVVPAFELHNELTWAVPLIIALVVAALGFFFYRVGLFIAICSSVYNALLPMLAGTTLKPPVQTLIALAVGVVLAIFAVKMFRSVIIFATAYAGAFGAMGILFDNWIHMSVGAGETLTIRLIIGAVIGTFGLIYQFRSSR